MIIDKISLNLGGRIQASRQDQLNYWFGTTYVSRQDQFHLINIIIKDDYCVNYRSRFGNCLLTGNLIQEIQEINKLRIL